MAELARLESVCTSKGYRGFESRSLRKYHAENESFGGSFISSDKLQPNVSISSNSSPKFRNRFKMGDRVKYKNPEIGSIQH